MFINQMKKVFSVLLAFVLATTMSLGAAERGKFIHVDASVNKNLKPQLAFSQAQKDGQPVTSLLVLTVNTNNFNEFSDASRVLLRFSDGKAVRLNIVPNAEIIKQKNTEKKGNATLTFYRTTSEYEVTPEVIEKLEAGVAIVKVRIVFQENELKDYDIAEGYQAKMAVDLLKSYQDAAYKNKKANGDLADEDF